MLSFSPHLERNGHGPYRLLRGVGDGLVRRFLSALQDPRAAQEQRLRLILHNLSGTRFAHDHPGLLRVQTLDDLRHALPIRTHADLLPWLDAVASGQPRVLTRTPVTSLLETSGTSGRPKWLPVTAPWARSVAEAQQLWVLAMIRDHEPVTRGKALTIVSPAEHTRSPGGLPVGSNTGRMHLAQPWWLRLRYPVPYRVFSLSPADLRLYTLLRFSLPQPISSLTTANPSTLLLLCRRLLLWQEDLAADLRDGTLRHGPARDLDPTTRRWMERRLRRHPPPTDWRPARLWPLALVNCWKGGPAQYFVDRLPDALGAPDIPIREVGVTASEGYFAIPLGDDWPGGVLWTEGHLLEFLPEDDPHAPLWSWELEVGRRYRLIITTEAGLYRYDLQDLVEVVGTCLQTPVIRFVGKAGRFLNATGEKVAEAQVSAAARDAARLTGIHPVGFAAHLRLAEIPQIELALEIPAPADTTTAAAAFARAFDAALQRLNVEYEGKRASARLGPVLPLPVPPGTFLRHRARRVAEGAPEGQVKDPILAIHDEEWTRILEAARPPE